MNKFVDTPDAVILANGSFPTHTIPLSYIQKAEYLVCSDGAANAFIAQGGKPDAIVGDGDSISPENKVRFAEIFHPNLDQETNDLTKSVNFCLEQGKRNIVIVGATGKRDDHALGNISLLAEYVQHENLRVKIITDYGIFTPIKSTTTFKSFEGQAVSFFSIDRETVTTSGLKYPLINNVLTNWWQATLNSSLGDYFTIETSGRVIVFQAHASE